jgi:hypothetical protein
MKNKRTNKPNYRVGRSFIESAHAPILIEAMKIINCKEYKDSKQLTKDAKRVAIIMNAVAEVKFFTLDTKSKSHLKGVKAVMGAWLCDDLIMNSPNEYGQKGSYDHPLTKAELNLIRKDIGIVNYKSRK